LGENECTDYLVREFDEKGRIVKETRYGIETTTYAYDPYGNCVKADFTRVEDSPCTIAWEYVYTPMVLTEAQVKEAEEYYTEKYIFP
jgi:YD repeat-containing protein